jgi:hypothetical protein
MDLRKIVEEVEQRKRDEYSLTTPAPAKPSPMERSGTAGSILESVRERMLRENPGADVGSLSQVIAPDHAVHHLHAAGARAEPPHSVVAIAREASKMKSDPNQAPSQRARDKDDFLARYLLMSQEFESRYGAKGWTELVRKQSSSRIRQ